MPDMDLNSPSVKISQRRMPYDHTSLRVVYRLWKMLSGAIHFKGRKVYGKLESIVRMCGFNHLFVYQVKFLPLIGATLTLPFEM